MIGLGHAAQSGTALHPENCNCSICRECEARELTAIIEHAEDRGWIVNPAARQRLAHIEAEQHVEVNHA
jgi:hypothetical protein